MFNKDKLRMLCSYSGIYILFLTVGIHLYWGNLSVYTNSYIRNYHGSRPDIKTPWVISLFSIGRSVNMILAGYLSGVIGHSCTVVLGCLLLDSGVSLTCFFIHGSVMEVNFSMGLLAGLGNGLILSIGFQKIVSFEPNNLGFVTGCIVTSVSLGGALHNQIVTAYINPNNLTPNLYDGNEKYFTQPEVLDRVPNIFLVLGLFSLVCNVTGILLLLLGENNQDHNVKPPDGHLGGETDMEESQALVAPSINGSEPEEKEEIRADTPNVLASTENLSPRQILKCRHFYVLSLVFIIGNYSYVVMNTYCKIYGQTRISDDQFLARLSTVLVIAMLMMRPWWGVIIDKYGLKTTLVYLSCTLCVVPSFWYFTPMVSRWLFLLWSSLYACCNSGMILCVPLATRKLFGKEHFSKNYGFVVSSCIVSNLMAPSVMRFVLDSFGWFYLFLSVACANVPGMVLSLLIFPEI